MSDCLVMIPQQCQEASCKVVYRCKLGSDSHEIEAQCKACNFDHGCQVQEKIQVLPAEFGICQVCYQHLTEAD